MSTQINGINILNRDECFQISLSTRQKQTHRHREQADGCQGEGDVREGWIGSWD